MKKNKKLFAILTLVAFMMTLVPALAFAETSAIADPQYAADGDMTLTVTGYTEGEKAYLVDTSKVKKLI